MFTKIASFLGLLASVSAPSPQNAPKPLPEPPPGGTIIVRVLPKSDGTLPDNIMIITDIRTKDENNTTDGTAQNNTADNSTQDIINNTAQNGINPVTIDIAPEETISTADARYYEQKQKLDEKFERMFTLKKELDDLQGMVNSKWEEYNLLRNAYERSLKRLIANWVVDQSV